MNLIIVIMVVYPIVMARLLVKNYNKLQTRETRDKYEILYSSMNIKFRGRKTVLYYPLFLLKRWIVIMIPIMGIKPGLQLICLLHLSKLSIILYGWMNSYD